MMRLCLVDEKNMYLIHDCDVCVQVAYRYGTQESHPADNLTSSGA